MRRVAVLKEQVVPLLRRLGFKGTFPHFRRLDLPAIHLITFQFDQWGTGKFCVEVAKTTIHARDSCGIRINPKSVTARHLSDRLRLGEKAGDQDHWFGGRAGQAANEVTSLLETQAEEFWKKPDTICAWCWLQVQEGGRPDGHCRTCRS